jgi:hypothetical protein
VLAAHPQGHANVSLGRLLSPGERPAIAPIQKDWAHYEVSTLIEDPHFGNDGLYPRTNRRVPHILLVFREMWDTAGLPSDLLRDPQFRRGAPCSHERFPDFLPAVLGTTTHAAFSQESRMMLLNATSLDGKSGIRGPKTTGEALRKPLVPNRTAAIRSGAL